MAGANASLALALPRAAIGSLALGLAMAAAPAQASDPRIQLVEKQVARQHEEALADVESHLASNPEVARGLGFDYLRGHLLMLLDRRQEAIQAFATSMGSTPQLEAYSRFRLAREQEDLDRPEVAAGLAATLLGSNPPRSLVGPAVQMLQRTIERGGDCRLLTSLNPQRYSRRDRRRLALANAACLERSDQHDRAVQQLLVLLEENRGDDVALAAAHRLVAKAPAVMAPRTHLLLGLTFFQHREFGIAIQHLATVQVRLPNATDITSREAFECRYALARSHFWQERFGPAAAAFGALFRTASTPTHKAQVLFQRGRSLELAGDWEKAATSFDQAYRVDPTGRWMDGALIGGARLQWLSGQEDAALAAIDKLVARRKYTLASRTLLFLVSSDLVQGRFDRAGAWLSRASQLGKTPIPELAYWQGRLAEGQRQPVRAVEHYIDAIERDPYHPFGRASLARMEQQPLAPVARAFASKLAASSKPSDLYAAWLILGDANSQGKRAHHRLEEQLWNDASAIPFLRLTRQPTADWPLWQASLRRPEEMLLALGIFEEGASVVLRHFPVAEPGLAFTGGVALAQSGEIKRALYIAEVLGKRIPSRIPQPLLPADYRRLLFPFGYSYLILSESEKRDVDPHLLAAIIREESRFDPNAFSGASARGLTQFVLPTARRIARKIGLGEIEPSDLEKPEVAITLGAAYLSELDERFDGSLPQAVAAYNAGEAQSTLWRRYCFSDEPEELISKIGFKETRGYVSKVLTSREHYKELYASNGGRPTVRPAVEADP